MIPLLLKPRIQKLQNRWRLREEFQQLWSRNLILGSMTLLLMYGLYIGGFWLLEQTQTQLDFAYLSSSTLLGLLLFVLGALLFVANTIAAIGSLFLANDLQLILSAPIPPWRLFWGKLCETVVTSSWMTALFLLPLVILFGAFYKASIEYYAIALVVFIPYFLIPAALAILVSLSIALVFPAERKKELLFVVLLFALYGLYLGGVSLASGFDRSTPFDISDLLRVLSFLSLANNTWSPSYWAAAGLGELLEPQGLPAAAMVQLLYTSSAVLIYFVILCFGLDTIKLIRELRWVCLLEACQAKLAMFVGIVCWDGLLLLSVL